MTSYTKNIESFVSSQANNILFESFNRYCIDPWDFTRIIFVEAAGLIRLLDGKYLYQTISNLISTLLKSKTENSRLISYKLFIIYEKLFEKDTVKNISRDFLDYFIESDTFSFTNIIKHQFFLKMLGLSLTTDSVKSTEIISMEN